jgi:hypothetical protein
MNALARSLTLAVAVLALCICSLAPAPASAGQAATVTASIVPNVANTGVQGQPGYDAYVLSSSYIFNSHNCPPENCGTVDQCGFQAPGTPCGTLPGCTCKKCHNWGVCVR